MRILTKTLLVTTSRNFNSISKFYLYFYCCYFPFKVYILNRQFRFRFSHPFTKLFNWFFFINIFTFLYRLIEIEKDEKQIITIIYIYVVFVCVCTYADIYKYVFLIKPIDLTVVFTSFRLYFILHYRFKPICRKV